MMTTFNSSLKYVFILDEEEARENLSNCSLETIVERAKSTDPKTQLDAVQVYFSLFVLSTCKKSRIKLKIKT